MARVKINFPKSVHFSKIQEVRIQDVNYRKHVGHDKLISMLHEARAGFFETIGESEMADSPKGYILADLEIQYLGEAFFGDKLNFEISVDEISSRSCNFYYQVSRASDMQDAEPTLIARAKTAVVFFDYELEKAIAVPESLLELKSVDPVSAIAC